MERHPQHQLIGSHGKSSCLERSSLCPAVTLATVATSVERQSNQLQSNMLAGVPRDKRPSRKLGGITNRLQVYSTWHDKRCQMADKCPYTAPSSYTVNLKSSKVQKSARNRPCIIKQPKIQLPETCFFFFKQRRRVFFDPRRRAVFIVGINIKPERPCLCNVTGVCSFSPDHGLVRHFWQ